MAGVSSIDKLPEIERLKVIKALTEAGEAPDFRGLIAKLKLKCSHVALWRYHRNKILPAIKRNVAHALVAMDDTIVHQDKGDSIEQKIAAREQLESVTRQALIDDPIKSLWIAQQQRLHRAIGNTLDSGQLDTYAKLESVAAKNYEGHARTILHPGFTAAAAPSSNTNIVLVLPGAVQPAQGDVIDVEVVE